MGKIDVLGTGLKGLVGSRIVDLLGDFCEFENISLSGGIDISKKDEVLDKIKSSSASVVIHLAAKTNVDACEKDKDRDLKIIGYKDIKRQEEEWIREKTAWGVNVVGTKNVLDACIQFNKRLIYVSTDFVFDGESSSYNEEDLTNPINWYGRTKYEAEKIIQNSSISYTIVRTAYPYRSNFEKNDFVRAMLKKFQSGEMVNAIFDHIMTPTLVDDLAGALNFLIKNTTNGIFHVVGSQFVSPYDAALLIAKVFCMDSSNIKKTTKEEYFKNKAPRPYRLALKNDKIKKLGLKMSTFEEGLIKIKKQTIS